MSDADPNAPAADPVVTAAPPSLEDRAKVCGALAAAFHDARSKSAASDAAAEADRARSENAHADLMSAIAELLTAAQA